MPSEEVQQSPLMCGCQRRDQLRGEQLAGCTALIAAQADMAVVAASVHGAGSCYLSAIGPHLAAACPRDAVRVMRLIGASGSARWVEEAPEHQLGCLELSLLDVLCQLSAARA